MNDSFSFDIAEYNYKSQISFFSPILGEVSNF